MATKKTKVAEESTEALATQGKTIAVAPELDMDLLEQFAGEGLEGADSQECFGIPYIVVVQSNTPELVDGLVEGIRQGQFLNSVTKEVYDEVRFVPCAFERRFKLWGPRNQGGGFKGVFTTADIELGAERIPGFVNVGLNYFANVPKGSENDLYDNKGKPKFDEIKDSRDHFVLFQGRLAGGEWSHVEPAVISLTSTQIKKSKSLLTMIRNAQETSPKTGLTFTPPSFSRWYKATTTGEKNAEGSWFGWVISFESKVTDPVLFALAKKFRDEVAAGAVIVQEDSVNNANSSTSNEEKF